MFSISCGVNCGFFYLSKGCFAHRETRWFGEERTLAMNQSWQFATGALDVLQWNVGITGTPNVFLNFL